MSQSEQIGELAGALAAASLEFGAATKNAKNPHFGNQYANLDSAITATRDALAKHGLVVIQRFTPQDTLITTLAHKSGQWISGEYALGATKQDPQGRGSASTYARRYGLMAILGIAPEDDDGNAGSAGNRYSGVRLQSVDAIKGEDGKTLYRIQTASGRFLTTFSKTLAESAKKAAEAGATVTITVEQVGEHTNLTGIA